MGKKVKRWSWTSAFVGAAATAAVTALVSTKPKDPSFRLVSIGLKSFKPRLPVLDPELMFTVHVSNPNAFAADYSSATMSIFYEGAQLGSAEFQAGSHPARSCQFFRLPARLDGLALVQRAGRLFGDAAKGAIVLEAQMELEGTAKVLWRDRRFKVHVDSHLTVHPASLDIIDQENRSRLQVLLP